MNPMSTDAELLLQYRETRDRGALDELFGRHYPSIFHVLLRICGNEFDARDLSQATFLKALASLEQYRGDGAFRPWLIKIAVNEFRNQRRRVRPATAPDAVFEMYSELKQEHSQQAAERAEFERALHDALSDFPEDLRVPLVLYYYQDLSMADIAGALDIPKSTAHNRVRQALERLRRDFTSKGFFSLVPLLGNYFPGIQLSAETAGATAGLTSEASATLSPLALGTAAMKLKLAVAASILTLLSLGAYLFSNRNAEELLQIETDESSDIATPRGDVPADTTHAEAAVPFPGDVAAASSATLDLSRQFAPEIHSTGPGSVHGRVLQRSTYAPVAGAEIVLDLNFDFTNDWIGPGHPDFFRNRYYTDAEGKFVCGSLPMRRTFRITIRHEGFGYLDASPVTLTGKYEQNIGTFLLDPEIMLPGMVTDDNGVGLAGVEITAGDFSVQRADAFTQRFPALPLQGASTLTGPDGSFVLRGLSTGDHRLEFRKPGYARAALSSVRVSASEPAAPLRVTLKRGTTLGGRVVDDRDEPVEGVSLCALLSETVRLGNAGAMRTGFFAGTRSDADGHFQFSDLPDASQYKYHISSEKDGYVPSEIGELRPGNEHLLIRLTPVGKYMLRGRIVEKDTGLPVRSSAHIKAWSGEQKYFMGIITSEADGSFEYPNLMPGPVALSVTAAGYLGARMDVPDVRARSTIRIELPSGKTLSGVVRDEITGAPVAGARVYDVMGSDIDEGYVNRAVTDDTGFFTLDGIDPDGLSDEYDSTGMILVRAEGYHELSPGLHSTSLSPGATVEYSLRPVDTLRVSGLVIDEKNNPVPDAWVTINARWNNSGVFRCGKDGRFEGILETDIKISSQDDPDAGASTIPVIVMREGYASQLVWLPRGELGENMAFTLQAGLTLKGSIVDDHGQFLPNALILVAPAVGSEEELESEFGESSFLHNLTGSNNNNAPDDDPDNIGKTFGACGDNGNFQVGNIAPGRYWVVPVAPNATWVERASYRDFLFDLAKDRSGLQFALRRGGTVAGRVVDANGQPLAGILVRNDDSPGGTRTDERGQFLLETVFSDPAQVYLQDNRYLDETHSIPSGTAGVELVARPAGSLRLVVIDPDTNLGMPGMTVHVRWHGHGVEDLKADVQDNGYLNKTVSTGIVDITIVDTNPAGMWGEFRLNDQVIEQGKTLNLGQIALPRK